MTAQEILTEANLQDSYWGQAIIDVEKFGSTFSISKLREAGNWCTCACGRITCDIPRRFSPAFEGEGETWPLDKDLYDLGMEFYDAVCRNAFEEAAITLVHIEKRAIIVAKEYRLTKGENLVDVD